MNLCHFFVVGGRKWNTWIDPVEASRSSSFFSLWSYCDLWRALCNNLQHPLYSHGTGGWLSRYDIYYNDCIVLDWGECLTTLLVGFLADMCWMCHHDVMNVLYCSCYRYSDYYLYKVVCSIFKTVFFEVWHLHVKLHFTF